MSTTDSRGGSARKTPAGAPRGAKRVLFAILTLGLPVALILLLELVLRMSGYGGYPDTFEVALTTPDGRRLMEAGNDRVESFFIRNRDLPGHLDRRHFWSPKPEGALRVVMVGESAIRGFPQPANLTAASFLQEMLQDLLPDRSIEVINLGTTAIASYPILELGTEALEQEPDVMVIQAGNNEFFGAFGVASLNKVGNSPGAIAFQRWGRSLAIVQWAESLGAKLRKPAAPGAGDASETLMERMMGRDFTAYDDPLRDAAARNAGAHVRKLIERCEGRGVPVVVCVTGVNERGMAPLGESRIDEVPEPDRARFSAALEIDPDSSQNRLEELRWAVEVAPHHARAHWLLGTAFHHSGQFEEAKAAFQKAVDLDPMPWRAPSSVLEAIHGATGGTDAVWVDAREALRAGADGGSIGWDLMDDHVHMSLRGQALVGRALLEGLARVPSLGIQPEALARLSDLGRYAERLGRNRFDERGVAYRMYKLLEVPFFTATNPWASRLMRERMERFDSAMTASEIQAMKAWEDPAASRDYGVPASAFGGHVCLTEKRYDEGARAYRGAARAIAPFSVLNLEFTFKWLTCAAQAGGLSEEELAYGRSAIERGRLMAVNPEGSEPAIQRFLGGLCAMTGDCESAVTHLERGRLAFRGADLAEIDRQIVECLVRLGRRNDAKAIVERGAMTEGPQSRLYVQMEALLDPPEDSR